ncbi:argonaute/piwi family protein [Syntrophobacter fumaroxidans]|uniref:argonaute/piwi family protein n=1 Tax=Syntrophobacter fumaroxidans TaxID=119484 RepID=UPI001FC96F6D|nr:Piwi domain-containing protein [Syntrophobacter fumaroxidans]
MLLNFSPIEFEDTEIEPGFFPYGTDGEQVLKELRQQYRATHVFRRDGPDQIIAVPVVADAQRLGEKPKKIRLKENLGLTASLIRNSLINYLVGLPRIVTNYDAIRFIAQEDILHSSLPPGVTCPDWIGVRLLYEMAVRPIYFFRQEPFIAAVIDVRTTRILDRTVGELLENGFSPVGHYVATRVSKYQDPRIAPRAELLGKVEAVEANTLALVDSKDHLQSVDANEVWLEKRAFSACLAHAFQGKDQLIGSDLEKARADLRSGPTKLRRINSIVEFFASKQYFLAPGISFKFTPLLSDDSKRQFPPLELAPKPTYIFDQTGSKTSTWNDGGLDQHGPYTAKVFTPNRPKLCVICQREQKGRVEQFLHKFINGIVLPTAVPSYRGRQKRNYFEKGLLRKYALQDVTYEFFLAEDRQPRSYKEACRQALEQHGAGMKWDLALVQIEESFHQLPVSQNPYFITKGSFLAHQIPVQEFEIETAQKNDRELQYSLNNMALATYAKMNGIPWLLKANPTIAHELIIGLGSANIADGRLGDSERYVGITTVFSGDGNYHLTNVSRAVTIDCYQKAFLEALRKAVSKVQQDMNWQPKDHVRLVFHASFKRFRQDEVNSVKLLMSELGNYEVEYAFLQLSEQHPYLLFDKSQSGVVDFETKRTKGVFAPKRASTLQLSKRAVLLCLTGPSEVKRPEDGVPSPLLLELHRDSSFTDMTYLSRQVFAFSCHSWRTFLPASVPVTIQYSDLIARTLGHLSLFEKWDPDVMLGRIGKTRWFL